MTPMEGISEVHALKDTKKSNENGEKRFILMKSWLPIQSTSSTLHSRCGGMIFTLISLVALGVVLSGLYFFSAGGAASPGAAAELWERERSAPDLPLPSPSGSQTPTIQNPECGPYLWRLRGMGLRLYLSETTTALAFFFTGTKDGVSSSSPEGKDLVLEMDCSSLNLHQAI